MFPKPRKIERNATAIPEPTPEQQLQTIIDSSPELPPLPADAINWFEREFRPRYIAFLKELCASIQDARVDECGRIWLGTEQINK